MNRTQCLEEATKIINNDRQNSYGAPEKNFGTISCYWSEYLQSLGYNIIVRPHDVAVMMCLLKIARLATSPMKEDNWVDLAGYAANGCELVENLTGTLKPSALFDVEDDED
jgi:hypothetical protein